MRMLVTGGTGFIGTNLALRAKDCGHEATVVGLTNTLAESANAQRLEAAGIAVRLAAVENLAGWRDALFASDVVFHLAAIQHEMNVPDARFREVNVEATARLVDAAVEGGLKRFVHASTIGVYGEGATRIDEATPPAPDNIYGTTKLEGERAVLAAKDRLPVTVIRVPETYGPGDRRLLKLFKAVKSGRFFMIGRGDNLHQPIFIDDLTDAFLLVAEHPAALGEVFLLAGPKPVTSNVMVAAIAQALGRPPPKLRTPMWPFLGAAYTLEHTLRPLGIQPPLHRRRMGFFTKSQEIDLAKAARLLGFKPNTGFAEGAARTARAYEAEGLL